MNFWVALIIALAAYDIDYTIRFVQPAAELNPVIRWLNPLVGWVSAVLAGIAIPTAATIGLSYILHAPTILAYVCGVRSLLTLKQSMLRG